jgi:hypothetical protein
MDSGIVEVVDAMLQAYGPLVLEYFGSLAFGYVVDE